MTSKIKTIKPLGDNVLIERLERTATKGGIILPESAQEKPKEGTVVAVGPGKTDSEGVTKALSVKVGDRVLFSSYAGTELEKEGNDFLIIAEKDLLGVLTD